MPEAILFDLHQDFECTVADINEERLHHLGSTFKVATLLADLSDPEAITKAIAGADIVAGAVPGRLGYQMLQTVIAAGKPIADISFSPEDPMDLDKQAKAAGVPVIVDMGVAPGMSNLFAGHHHAAGMDVRHFACYVGGLPVARHWPYEYKAPFSPIDVIEEYVRPARYRLDGHEVVRPALSEPELLDFPGIGTLEAFNTDGLRTLLRTMQFPTMIEKTLRYPGHIDLMRALRETGYFSYDLVTLNDGTTVRPIDLTAKLLLPMWELEDDEPEFTLMRVVLEGHENGEQVSYTYNLLDYRDSASGLSSMARTTGFTCAAAVRLLAKGRVKQTGVLPPELLAAESGTQDFVLAHLEEMGVRWGVERSLG